MSAAQAPQLQRGLSPSHLPSYIYEGIITNHLDPTKQGMVEVSVKFLIAGDPNIKEQTYVVRYVSPFAGNTNVLYEGTNENKYDDVQKSYGMWMIPPDIGTRVLVAFANSDFNQGYIIGFLWDEQQNFMVPGIAATKNTAMTASQLAKYKTSNLPVAEPLKSTRTGEKGPLVDKLAKPVHPFADRLLEQGLLLDDARGTTTSSARREIPSYVFGISTPGPLDKNGPKKPLNKLATTPSPVSRLGGSTFVMDDGDIDGENELVRIRTRTGHQILLHNTKDLIYIGNAKGTAWIELTSQGKIDIYAADSVSIHSEQDLNFRADRNINLEAGGNVNISSNMTTQIESGSDFNLLSGLDFNIQSNNSVSVYAESGMNLKSNSVVNFEADDSFNLKSNNATLKLSSNGNLSLYSDADILETAENIHLKANVDLFMTTGGQVHQNAVPATPTSAADDASTTAVSPLARFSLPNRSVYGSWENNFYQVEDLLTIMTRVPTHEPYDQHESVNPNEFNSVNLNNNPGSASYKKLSVEAAKKITGIFKLPPNTQGTPPRPTGNQEQDNLQAFLYMIRFAEGTTGSIGYQRQWPNRQFDITSEKIKNVYGKEVDNIALSFKDHPREVRRANGIPSSAAGAYQFLTDTWDECKTALGLTDFGPANQDKACIFLLARNNSIDLIKQGRFYEALDRNKKTWASLPGANYKNQPMKQASTLLAEFKKAGGKAVV